MRLLNEIDELLVSQNRVSEVTFDMIVRFGRNF